MRKITAFLITLTVLVPTFASAETIYTSSPVEYSEKLAELSRDTAPDIPSVFRISSGPADASERRLLVYCEGELDALGAEHDIIDEYNIHTLIYNTAEDAEAAYEYYVENDIPVCHDEILQIENISWGYDMIGTDAFVSGLRSTYSTVSMPNITVAVVDTGIDYNHTFLRSRVDASQGWDFYNNDDNPMDDNDHGTHVAGIIADNTLSNVTIIPIKVTGSDGKTDAATLKAGLAYADKIGADVINMSIADASEDTSQRMRSSFDPIFDKIHNNGGVICVSAGNADIYGRTHNADYIFPAYMDNTIAVANCTQNGSVSKSSNYGSVIDISAPGTGIYSTIPNNKYANMSGTSMASPFAAAAAALLKTKNLLISPDEIEGELRANATPYSAEFEDDYYGRYGIGILNISNYYYEPSDDPVRTEAPTHTPSPTPSIIPGHEQLISNVKFNNDNGVITALVKNTDGILNDGAVIMAVGYKNGTPAKMKADSVLSDGDVVFNTYLENADQYDKITLYVWRSFDTALPLSQSQSIQVLESNGEYIVQVLNE